MSFRLMDKAKAAGCSRAFCFCVTAAEGIGGYLRIVRHCLVQ